MTEVTFDSAEIKAMLDSGAENRNFDFKKGFGLKDKTVETLGLVADIMACANTQDGGTIILGFDDKTLQFSSESGKWWESFDITKIVDILNKYCDPRVEIQVFKKIDFEYKGRNGPIVVLKVPEFTDVPILCKTSGTASDGTCVLKPSEFYIRTNRASTEVISNAHDLRELIGRAMLKHGDKLLHAFSAIVTGQHISKSSTNVLEQYNEEIGATEDEIG